MADRSEEFDVGSSEDLQRRNGWYIENWTAPNLDAAQVPVSLQHLISAARQWGISCDVTRRDAGSKATDEQLTSLTEQLDRSHAIYEDWTFGGMDDFDPSSEECSVFGAMYLFEMEYAEGPGIRSKLEWAIDRYEVEQSEHKRVILQECLEQTLRRGRRFVRTRRESVDRAQRLLAE
ncbi:hypothetical protein [Roseimaritima sediminicola]|uniref:hypothetical protein n=1 Tax=Roseimaritima sediminicola TaxID=2662066 RepID=UPI00129857B0|nr:hypothetical protein [Roseimaritima sediminicola]